MQAAPLAAERMTEIQDAAAEDFELIPLVVCTFRKWMEGNNIGTKSTQMSYARHFFKLFVEEKKSLSAMATDAYYELQQAYLATQPVKDHHRTAAVKKFAEFWVAEGEALWSKKGPWSNEYEKLYKLSPESRSPSGKAPLAVNSEVLSEAKVEEAEDKGVAAVPSLEAESVTDKVEPENEDSTLAGNMAKALIEMDNIEVDDRPQDKKKQKKRKKPETSDDLEAIGGKRLKLEESKDESQAEAQAEADRSDTEYLDVDLEAFEATLFLRGSGNHKVDGEYTRLPTPSRGAPCYCKDGTEAKRAIYLYWKKHWRISNTKGSEKCLAQIKAMGQSILPCEPYPHQWKIQGKHHDDKGHHKTLALAMRLIEGPAMDPLDEALPVLLEDTGSKARHLPIGSPRRQKPKPTNDSAIIPSDAAGAAATEAGLEAGAADVAPPSGDGGAAQGDGEGAAEVGSEGEEEEASSSSSSAAGEQSDSDSSASSSSNSGDEATGAPERRPQEPGRPQDPGTSPEAKPAGRPRPPPGPPPVKLMQLSPTAAKFAEQMRSKMMMGKPAEALGRIIKLKAVDDSHQVLKMAKANGMSKEQFHHMLKELEEEYGAKAAAARAAAPAPRTPPGEAPALKPVVQRSKLRRRNAELRTAEALQSTPRVSIVMDVNFVPQTEQVAVVSYRSQMEQLWYVSPGAFVMCDRCGVNAPQFGGAMMGAPSRSQFAQCEFVCGSCKGGDT